MPKKIIQECLSILAARCTSCNCMTYFYCAPLQSCRRILCNKRCNFLYTQKSDWFIPITSYYKIYTFKIAYKKLFNILPIHLTWLCPRPISNSQLHVLPHFHLCPIYLVVFKGSYNFRWDISS